MKKQNKKFVRSKKNHHKTNKLAFIRFAPALAISLIATTLWAQPHMTSLKTTTDDKGVLAKATNTTHTGLLNATNSQRSANGVGTLAINGTLNSAAQAKANDMVTRGYWSHVTPDGKQPWWFISNAGYNYSSAGENLAYGYLTSNSTVTGWMNSTSHRQNMLNSVFTEVGFGIADTDDYVYNGTSHGPQTIVVAMYAKPQVAAAAAPAPAAPAPTSTAAPTPKPAVQATQPAESVPEEVPADDKEASEATPSENKDEETIAIENDEVLVAAAPTSVNRIQMLTGGNAAWSASLVLLAVLSSVGLWLIHKGIHIRKYVLAGEHFIASHPHLDLTVLALLYLGFVLLSSNVVIR